MKQKMYMPLLAFVLMVSTFASNAATTISLNDKPLTTSVVAATEEQKKVKLEAIKMRLEEIREMDKSALTKQQRKDLKAEVRSLGKEARSNGGIYLSVGAVIIIILLLILIL